MASTTIVPFGSLPSCASSCYVLYDVNGKCVPPATTSAAATVYEQCFCADTRLTAFSTGTAGPCDAACTATPADYGSITSWYQSMCKSVQANIKVTTNADGSTSTVTVSGSGSSSNSSGGGGDWLSGHWRWVVFIIVMVLGIAGIWIGAAIWRRHYLRKRDRQYALGKNLAARTGSGTNPYGGGGNGTPPMHNGSRTSQHPPEPGMFMAAPIQSAAVYSEKPKKTRKKWRVTERT